MTKRDRYLETLDWHGQMRRQRIVGGKGIADMMIPVECSHCRYVYDLCGVETYNPETGHAYGRYADCTMYRTPCCKRVVDDRPAGWVSFPAFTKLDRQGRPLAR